MDSNLDELLGLVGGLGEKLKKNPKGLEVFNKIKRGEISEDDAVDALFLALAEDGLLGEVLSASLRAQQILKIPKEILPVLVDPQGKSEINPLWEAALAERASLDGDVPALRHGPMPPGSTPAVPVLLTGLDPVAAGWMLEKAATEVSKRLIQGRKAHEELVSRTLALTERGARESGADIRNALQIAHKHLPEAPKGVPGYQAGETPDFWAVAEPTAAEILNLGEELAQAYSYKALSTTQGRVSLGRPLQRFLTKRLRALGFDVIEGSPSKTSAHAQWVVAAYGAGDFSPRFNYVEAALSALTSNLSKKLGEISPKVTLLCEVTPYNGISTRTFGWQARIGVSDANPD